MEVDVLVVGSGAAGLRAAIEARQAGANVVILSKTKAGLASCSAYAGGGMQAPIGSLTPEEHYRRAVIAGRFLNNQTLLGIVSSEAKVRLLELSRFGVDLEEGDGSVRVKGPFMMNGTGLTLPLLSFAESANIHVIDDTTVIDLIQNEGEVAGGVALSRKSGEIKAFSAKSTILATGGAGQLYSRTDTPVGTTGEGYATA